MSISEDRQSLSPGAIVTLFDLDLTPIGGSTVERWTPHSGESGGLQWRGNTYTSVPVEAEGFEKNAGGQLPRPRIRVSNVLRGVTTLLAVLASETGSTDITGAKLTRWRTLRHFLDDGASPDPNMHYPVEIWHVDRKVRLDFEVAEYELAAELDQQGVYLPRRQVLRDTCTAIYRSFDPDGSESNEGGPFNYAAATCPYRDNVYFDQQGNPVVSASGDACGHKVSDCVLRFGENPLPYWGFAGVAKIRG